MSPQRTGAILATAEGDRRIPEWLLQAIEVADAFVAGGSDAAHWETLARFRGALDPGIRMAPAGDAARLSMTDFLEGLKIRVVDSFSIAPKDTPSGPEFEVVPFSGQTIDELEQVNEEDAEVRGSELSSFQDRVRSRGALPAYRVENNSYVVVDRSAMPALRVMARMQHATREEREAFIRNPRPLITKEVEESLRASGRLDGLSDAGVEEAIESAAGPLFVETRQYSERVVGIGRFQPPTIEGAGAQPTTWLPEIFAKPVAEFIDKLDSHRLDELAKDIQAAIESGRDTITIDDHEVPATHETLKAIKTLQEHRAATAGRDEDKSEETDEGGGGPIVIETADNFTELRWRPSRSARKPTVSSSLPGGLRTAPKNHQVEGFHWQVKAWTYGLPGVLNADEQGLGKTLQTIAFLRWLKAHMEDPSAGHRGPILVVAPTSLLETWEGEVQRHLDEPHLGHLIRLYGSGISAYKKHGAAGVDTMTGEELLDFSQMHEAIAEGRSHRFWILTTYTTLTNYQHSLAKIPFAAAIFDEIQTLKNPTSLRSFAARAINADFRIGLTGTPIENSTVDLWAIMDQLCPGAFGTLKEFSKAYGTADETSARDLH
ncbi:MAG: SNF2-related protein, partial [Hypericibacter sp.]